MKQENSGNQPSIADRFGEEYLESILRELEAQTSGHLIEGRWQPGSAGNALTTEDPATGRAIAEFAAGNADDIDRAVTAAETALRSGCWPRLTASQRAALLFALADRIEREADQWALIEALDAGHTLTSIAGGDLPLGLRALRDNAGWANKVTGATAMQSAGQGGANYYLREPVGVVGIITPWNAPFLMTIQKLSAALAAGCTVVVKPSELAPLSALRIGEACRKVGFPPGVINIVTGDGSAGAALARHPAVNMVSFTGSVDTGRSIIAAAANSNLKRTVLELGGKSPVIVFDDADLPRAAAAIASEICFKSGQYCAAGSRLFVQRTVYPIFIDLLGAEMARVRVGAGYRQDVDMGAMICERQRARAAAIVGEAIEQGARASAGGTPMPGAGYFFRPTILEGVDPGARAWREEIFAPVIAVTAFEDGSAPGAVAALANDSAYGLSAKVWTQDLRRAMEMVACLQTGQVIVNGGGGEATLPFGGTKLSGYGRENGLEGVSAFTEIKAVRLGYPP